MSRQETDGCFLYHENKKHKYFAYYTDIYNEYPKCIFIRVFA